MAFRNAGGASYRIGSTYGLSTAGGVSISCWYQTPAPWVSTFRGIMNLVTDASSPSWQISFWLPNAAQIASRWGASGSLASVAASPVAPGQWYFCAATAQSGVNPLGTAYFARWPQNDFFISGSANATGTIPATMNGITIGDPFASQTATPGQGVIANARVWQRVLTRQEFLAEMRSDSPVLERDLYGWYPLKGPVASKGIDMSGLGHHITFNGSAHQDWPDPEVNPIRRSNRRRSTSTLVAGNLALGFPGSTGSSLTQRMH